MRDLEGPILGWSSDVKWRLKKLDAWVDMRLIILILVFLGGVIIVAMRYCDDSCCFPRFLVVSMTIYCRNYEICMLYHTL